MSLSENRETLFTLYCHHSTVDNNNAMQKKLFDSC